MNDNGGDNVVFLDGLTKLEVPVERVLKGAMETGLTSVFILGYTEDGEEYFASSDPNGPRLYWLLARAQKRLMEMEDE